MNQINRTEKNYSDLEKLYNDLLKQHADLQKDHTKFGTKIKDLQSELKSVSRKLTDANQDYYSLNVRFLFTKINHNFIYLITKCFLNIAKVQRSKCHSVLYLYQSITIFCA